MITFIKNKNHKDERTVKIVSACLLFTPFGHKLPSAQYKRQHFSVNLHAIYQNPPLAKSQKAHITDTRERQ